MAHASGYFSHKHQMRCLVQENFGQFLMRNDGRDVSNRAKIIVDVFCTCEDARFLHHLAPFDTFCAGISTILRLKILCASWFVVYRAL